MEESLLNTAVRYNLFSALGLPEHKIRKHLLETVSQPGTETFLSPRGTSAAFYWPLAWDTSLLGFPVGYIKLISSKSPSDDPFEAVRALTAHANSKGVRLVYAKASAEDEQSAKALLALGFSRVDKGITLAMKCGGSRMRKPHKVSGGALEEIASIARRAFTESRFYKDPKMGAERASMVYEKWVRDAVKNPDKGFLVCGEGGAPAGFLLYSRRKIPALGISMLSVDLIAVSEKHRGKGFGRCLMEDFIGLGGADYLLVGTQKSNSGALALYKKMGFKLIFKESSFHWWA